jgi:AraC family transcriptional regulator, transcriptional activator of the genes for pyochelin and ferripyochelin receptors
MSLKNNVRHMQRHLDTAKDGAVLVVQNAVGKTGDVHGVDFFEEINLRPGFVMLIADYAQSGPSKTDFEIDRAPVSFSYNLSQRVRCIMTSSSGGKRRMERSPKDSVLAYLPHTKGTHNMAPDKWVAGVSFHFSVPCFRELFKDVPECLSFLDSPFSSPSGEQCFCHQARFTSEVFFIIHQILRCPYGGDVRKLFLEAKALELVALKLAEMGQDNHRDPSALSRRDSERVREAYHILLDKIERPPGLNDLSLRVGINRNKLNLGFKQLYGDTVFNVLRRIRLRRSWFLLQYTDLSLTEIAFTVGYNNHANFSTAFRRQFGTPPKTVRQCKNRYPFDQASDFAGPCDA